MLGNSLEAPRRSLLYYSFSVLSVKSGILQWNWPLGIKSLGLIIAIPFQINKGKSMVTPDNSWQVTLYFFFRMRNQTHLSLTMCAGFSRFHISMTKAKRKIKKIFSK